jgi:hypothetical protein
VIIVELYRQLIVLTGSRRQQASSISSVAIEISTIDFYCQREMKALLDVNELKQCDGNESRGTYFAEALEENSARSEISAFPTASGPINCSCYSRTINRSFS